MHTTGTVRLGCTDCHGGNASVMPPAGAQKGSAGYDEAKKKAHPKPSIPELWKSSANPVRPYTEWLKETKEYIQFVNPGDLRVARRNLRLGRCHVKEVCAVRTSMMTTGAMLWEAALYNNGGYPYKDAHFGESYSPDGMRAAPATPIRRHRRTDAYQGRAAASRSAGPLGSLAARQYPARVRARRRRALRDRHSQSRRRSRRVPT